MSQHSRGTKEGQSPDPSISSGPTDAVELRSRPSCASNHNESLHKREDLPLPLPSHPPPGFLNRNLRQSMIRENNSHLRMPHYFPREQNRPSQFVARRREPYYHPYPLPPPRHYMRSAQQGFHPNHGGLSSTNNGERGGYMNMRQHQEQSGHSQHLSNTPSSMHTLPLSIHEFANQTRFPPNIQYEQAKMDTSKPQEAHYGSLPFPAVENIDADLSPLQRGLYPEDASFSRKMGNPYSYPNSPSSFIPTCYPQRIRNNSMYSPKELSLAMDGGGHNQGRLNDDRKQLIEEMNGTVNCENLESRNTDSMNEVRTHEKINPGFQSKKLSLKEGDMNEIMTQNNEKVIRFPNFNAYTFEYRDTDSAKEVKTIALRDICTLEPMDSKEGRDMKTGSLINQGYESQSSGLKQDHVNDALSQDGKTRGKSKDLDESQSLDLKDRNDIIQQSDEEVETIALRDICTLEPMDSKEGRDMKPGSLINQGYESQSSGLKQDHVNDALSQDIESAERILLCTTLTSELAHEKNIDGSLICDSDKSQVTDITHIHMNGAMPSSDKKSEETALCKRLESRDIDTAKEENKDEYCKGESNSFIQENRDITIPLSFGNMEVNEFNMTETSFKNFVGYDVNRNFSNDTDRNFSNDGNGENEEERPNPHKYSRSSSQVSDNFSVNNRTAVQPEEGDYHEMISSPKIEHTEIVENSESTSQSKESNYLEQRGQDPQGTSPAESCKESEGNRKLLVLESIKEDFVLQERFIKSKLKPQMQSVNRGDDSMEGSLLRQKIDVPSDDKVVMGQKKRHLFLRKLLQTSCIEDSSFKYPNAPLGEVWAKQALNLEINDISRINEPSSRNGCGMLLGRHWVWDEGTYTDRNCKIEIEKIDASDDQSAEHSKNLKDLNNKRSNYDCQRQGRVKITTQCENYDFNDAKFTFPTRPRRSERAANNASSRMSDVSKESS